MSLSVNLLANFAAQFWGAALAIVMVPLYVRYLGIEAYALIGFNSVLQMWLTLLDLGLSPTLARQMARFRAGEVSPNDAAELLRTLEKIFISMSCLVFVCAWAGRNWVAGEWFQTVRLPDSTVASSFVWMAATVGLRWLAGLYRGGIVGLDRQLWLNTVAIGVYTVRFGAVAFVIAVWPSLEVFFAFQATTAALECALLRWYLLRCIPAGTASGPVFSLRMLRRHGRFTLSLAFSSAVWVFVTQTDKLLLSKLMPLESYGYFSIAIAVSGGISLISFCLLQAFQPTFSYWAAKEGLGGPELTRRYHLTSQAAVVLVLPVAIVMAFWPQSVLLAWTGDPAIAESSAVILRYYAMGNAVLAITAAPYYLQVAHGDLRLHVIGNCIFGLTLIPLVYWAALNYGAVGASILWFGQNLCFLMFWPILVHRRLLPGESRRWYMHDLLMPAAAAFAAAFAVVWLSPFTAVGRGLAFAQCLLAWTVVSAAALLAATQVRHAVFSRFRR